MVILGQLDLLDRVERQGCVMIMGLSTIILEYPQYGIVVPTMYSSLPIRAVLSPARDGT